MNNIFKGLLIISTLGLCVPLTAQAQLQWEDWYIAPSIVYNDDDPDRRTDDSVSGLKIAGGVPLGRHFALEASFVYSDIDGFYRESEGGPYIRGSETQLDLEASILAYYNRDAVFAPYVVLGLGMQKSNLNFIGKETNPTGSAGFGFDWRIGDGPFSVRTEARLRRVEDGGDRSFTDSLVTLGFVYRFGGDAQDLGVPDKPKDTDGDGVLDIWDECPDTPPGVDVTARGCEIQDMTRDTDGDRVPDYRDQCPNTPTGAPVDPQGCSLDSDMDGVLTGQDRCPGSRPGAQVDEFGCEADNDGDGVLNQFDACPYTPAGVRVDVNGCEISDIIQLPGVNFGSGSDLLLPGFERLIMDAAATLNKYPNMTVEVAGHTDDVGDAALNQGLSERRAKTVRDFLIRYGVDPSRVTYRGYGESEPIANNTTVEGRAQNRRVELRITGQ
jgi:OOP family OmpA-OmpF porin